MKCVAFPCGYHANPGRIHAIRYNTLRTGEVVLDGRRFLLRRVYFPATPTPEWFVVDLLQHHDMAGVALSELRDGLAAILRLGRWDRERLREMAGTCGIKARLALAGEAMSDRRVNHARPTTQAEAFFPLRSSFRGHVIAITRRATPFG